MRKWAPILVLGSAQFVMVLDTTVMNAAISDVVADLDISVSQVQLAITLYTLVMAALMLTAASWATSSVAGGPSRSRPERASETGGLQGTAQNLGASLGTAMIGAVLLSGLGASVQKAVNEDPAIADPVKERVTQATESGIEFVPSSEVEAAARAAGAPPAQAEALTAHYADAQLFALKEAFAAAALFVLVGFWFTRPLPAEPLAGPGEAEEAPEALPG